jgi:hypothetical protein
VVAEEVPTPRDQDVAGADVIEDSFQLGAAIRAAEGRVRPDPYAAGRFQRLDS